jgi:hypothetical protein
MGLDLFCFNSSISDIDADIDVHRNLLMAIDVNRVRGRCNPRTVVQYR